MIKIAPSLLSSDFSRLAEVVRESAAAGADYLHIDVMDGHFVPNLTLGPVIVKAIRPHSDLYFDVHLMIESPERFIDDFAEAGANGLTVQVEAVNHLFRTVDAIHKAGMRAGVAICPGTPLSHIEEVAAVADLLLIMTVDPGFGGQAFISSMIPKIRRAAELVRRLDRTVEIEADGGIDPETAPLVAAAGATVLVAGSAIFRAGVSEAEAIARLRAAAVRGEH
ncbi:MAG: ribulose-phosphate 3-epimerase [Chloroflexi bacterium]|nr:ribulose-phosphate 3-epimerase [Chloroflexota bacterium]